MSDDIVTRLRLWCNWHDAGYYKDIRNEILQAADEIERLRRNTGCARNQRSTQFCAEALDAQREVARLTAERDEARREICEMLERDAGFSAHRQAASRGWDCFKEDGK